MKKYHILVLLDHRGHGAEESIYPLLRQMHQHPACGSIDVASRSTPGNGTFFEGLGAPLVKVVPVRASFAFQPHGRRFQRAHTYRHVGEYDVVLLRLAKPNPPMFFSFLEKHIDPRRIINRPSGILTAGSKAFLEHCRDLCPPLARCYDLPSLESFMEAHGTTVLKPFFQAGGKGILKIQDGKVWEGEQVHEWEAFLPVLETLLPAGFLAMKYLRAVGEGDKRINVVHGQVVAATLRMPPADSWMCNVSMGGTAVASTPTPEEQHLAEELSQRLAPYGIVMFGFDTLMDDQGQRVLSEINASNPGGLYPAELLSGEPVIARASAALWEYIGSHLDAQGAKLRLGKKVA